MKISRIKTTITLQRDGLDQDARTVPVTLATDTPLKHGPTTVILRHGEGALDVDHIGEDGIPLLVSHNGMNLPVGRIKELSMGDHATTGVAHFGRSMNAAEVFQDVTDGIITDVSVGADPSSPESIERLDDDTMVINRWRPIEGSLVSVGLDSRAKIHRSEDETMAFELANNEARTKRVADLVRIFEGLDSVEWLKMHNEALSNDDTIDAVQAKVLERLKAGSTTVQQKPLIQAGRDEGEKFIEGATASILHRSGILNGEEAKQVADVSRSSEFSGMSLNELARTYLHRQGVRTTGFSRSDIAGTAFVTRGIISHSGSDFGSILNDVANKSLAMAFEETPTTWQEWCGTGSLPDFKQAQISNTSTFSNVDQIHNDGEYEYGDLDDKHELAQLGTYGKLFSIGRKALINDDLSALTRVPTLMGRAQARKLNAAVYSILTTNAAMNEDSVALFATAHGNLGAGAAAPSVAMFNEAFTAMATQNAQGPDGGAQTGAVLNLRPSFFIGPAALFYTASTIIAASMNPATASGVEPNPFSGALTVVTDAELDADSTTHWYLAASPSTIDTVKVFWLDGATSPTMEQQEGFTRDGIIMKTRFDWAVAALDFRGMWHEGA